MGKRLTPFPTLSFDPHALNPGHHLGECAWPFLFGVSFCFGESTGLSSFVSGGYFLLFLTVAILLVSKGLFCHLIYLYSLLTWNPKGDS